MQQLLIEELSVQAIIGVYKKERVTPQPLVISIELDIDSSAAIQSDQLEDALDYYVLTSRIQTWLSQTQFQLLEALTDALLDQLLSEPQVQKAKVKVGKPQALKSAKMVYCIASKEASDVQNHYQGSTSPLACQKVPV